MSIISIRYFDWLYRLPLGSAALTPIGPPPAEAPPRELGNSLGAQKRERARLLLWAGGGGGGEGGGEGGGAGPAGGSGGDPAGVMVQVPGFGAELPG